MANTLKKMRQQILDVDAYLLHTLQTHECDECSGIMREAGDAELAEAKREKL
ncbi:hypothetical protein K445DRAFT_314200 [Daldinia sp. EC12]|nr:hypothetical protein K445DRAFT_314200 [Daldinia sp. EC12]